MIISIVITTQQQIQQVNRLPKDFFEWIFVIHIVVIGYDSVLLRSNEIRLIQTDFKLNQTEFMLF